MQIHPRMLILLGFFLVLSGFVIPFLMVLRVIQPGLLLSFFSYGASISGLLLGIIGIAWYTRPTKRH